MMNVLLSMVKIQLFINIGQLFLVNKQLPWAKKQLLMAILYCISS